MSNIQYNQQQSTFANVFLAVGVATQLFSIQPAPKNIGTYKIKSLINNVYNTNAQLSTYTSITNAITGDFYLIADSFEKVISNFYANLLAKQEPLGIEFEKILNDNLWELYES